MKQVQISYDGRRRTALTVCLLVWIQLLTTTVQAQEKKTVPFPLGMHQTHIVPGEGRTFNTKATKEMGLDFLIYHIPFNDLETQMKEMESLMREYEEQNVQLVVNVEGGNTKYEMKKSDGFDWINHTDYPHLLKFPAEKFRFFWQSKAVMGIMYDELEHTQITRNLSLALRRPDIDITTLCDPTGMTFEQADEAVRNAAARMVNEYKQDGARYIFTEHVWPVLFHNFARAGITPVYKQMKENWSNVWASCAMGACLQYDKELWACLDCWHYDIYPGHSVESLWANLLFAYWIGVDKAYIESNARHNYRVEGNDPEKVKLTDRGEVIREFMKEYVPAHPRTHTFRDLQPEIAIIRFDDTEWGQGPDTYCTTLDPMEKKTTLYWKDYLFGAKDLHTSPASEEWIRAWHTITHGQVSKESLSWNAMNAYMGKAYRCFAPANMPFVFDENVRSNHLKGVKLAFLCGLKISAETMKDVTTLVQKDGLTVVTSARFAPQRFAKQYTSGTQSFNDGKGRWIITDDMASDPLKEAVAPFLGKEDEITLSFKDGQRLTFKINIDGTEVSVAE